MLQLHMSMLCGIFMSIDDLEMDVCKLAEVPHRQSSLAIPNPIVCLSELSDDNQEDLQHQLDKMKVKISRKFLKLVANLIVSLRNRIKLEDLVVSLMQHVKIYPPENTYNASLLQGLKPALLCAKDVSEVFSVIDPFYSYYNYEIIQTITEVHGTDEDKRRMQHYLHDFSEFCKRTPCTEYCDDSSSQPSNLMQTKIKFKLDYDQERLTLAHIKTIKRQIAEILQIRSSVLMLQSVEKGCVAIIFLVPKFVADSLLDLVEDKRNILRTSVQLISVGLDHQSAKYMVSKILMVERSRDSIH